MITAAILPRLNKHIYNNFIILTLVLWYYHFKAAFHLHNMSLENQGYWYINDQAYQAQHEQGNTRQRPFVEHLPLPLKRDLLPVMK
jgi:hypothetical protein